MTALASFRHLALGTGPHIEKHQNLPDTDAPGVAVTKLFAYQSYFDDTLLEAALLTQSANEPIVGSTMDTINLSGYSFGLHPSSQTPVAVQPIIGNQNSAPQAVILKPGQVYRPNGRPNGDAANFSGIKWGLPYGWLGGGIATLYVFPSPDANVTWSGHSEVLFHRQRMQIKSPAAAPAAARKNWPLRFPWTQATRGASAVSQAGAAIISIGKPSRILMSLRLASLANPATMRMLFQGTNDFDLDSLSALILSPVRFIDYTWGLYAASGVAGNLGTNHPVVEISGEAVRLAADDGGVALVDLSASTLTDAFVDICRYGQI
jgi:hypothetical protein